MSSRKDFIPRSVSDRRNSLNRRIINMGPKYPGNEQRTGRDRRQCWEQRQAWQAINQWSSSQIRFSPPKVRDEYWENTPVADKAMTTNDNQ